MEIKTQYGLVEGVPTGGCVIYKGIPYAKPPVGALRWKAPQPPTAWEGVFHADHYSGRSIQRPRQKGSFYDREFGGGEEDTTLFTEDCLYLNVWTPEAGTEGKCPVAVYIHGGAFLGGCGHEKEFDGTALVKNGVILVTINYRLGVWGFLAHPWLSAENEHGVSGNYGILDQIAALRWVKENIAAFGGDPENVTVFGQSAGAISTLALVSSPLTKGLIHKAILESGLGLHCNVPLKQAEADGVEFAGYAGAASLEALRALPADQVSQAAGPLIMKGFQNGGVLVYEPVIDGYVLPDTFENLQKQGKIHDIPYIVGSNRNDMRTDPAALAAGDKGPMYQEVLTFTRRVSGVQKSGIYAYYFTRQLPGDDAGAFHSAELWYVFGSLGQCWRPMEQADYALSERMVKCWTDFMKTGDPGWKPYTQDGGYIEEFDS